MHLVISVSHGLDRLIVILSRLCGNLHGNLCGSAISTGISVLVGLELACNTSTIILVTTW
jgi:hypothetical protein